jgi:hypothetical protein
MDSEAPPVFDLFALIVFGGESGLCHRQKKISERVRWLTYAGLSLFGVRLVSSSSSDKKRFFLGDICSEV